MDETRIHWLAESRAGELVSSMPEYRGDPAAEEMIACHLAYLALHHVLEIYIDKELSPTMKGGIAFFQVGRNATHDFYMGMKDGKRYGLYIGPGDCDENGRETTDVRITEVSDWKGYWGHY
ncbi:MAG: hypothetical protein AAB575_00420 [Patescibacteria group bacterium]